MVHDDDTGRRVEFSIPTSSSSRERPSRPRRLEQLPSIGVQEQIVSWAKSPGVDVERIYARLRRTRHDITRDMIWHILDQVARTPRRRP